MCICLPGIHDNYISCNCPGKELNILPTLQLINRFGNAFLARKMFEKAYELFKLNLDNYPENENVYQSLGNYYAQTGDQTKAIEFYEKSLTIVDDSDVRERIKKLGEKK